MIITDSSIAMSSARSFTSKDEFSEELTVWVGDRPGAALGATETGPDPVSLSEEALVFKPLTSRYLEEVEIDLPDGPDPMYLLKKLLIEAIFGREIEVLDVTEISEEDVDAPVTTDPADAEADDGQAGWGIEYNRHELHAETESTSFTASGRVRTADGREIDFRFQLDMSRSFEISSDTSFGAGDAVVKDPLVINFNGTAAELTGARFSFDLDSDGTDENVRFVGSGSGFLVFDKNADRIVNNGSELFGPATGNGFAELALLDADNNSWIDVADPYYRDLYVWTKDASGADTLTGLDDAGVGAIYLGSKSTSFDLRDASNALDGVVRRTGVYLAENGTVGSVQQIDLVV